MSSGDRLWFSGIVGCNFCPFLFQRDVLRDECQSLRERLAKYEGKESALCEVVKSNQDELAMKASRVLVSIKGQHAVVGLRFNLIFYLFKGTGRNKPQTGPKLSAAERTARQRYQTVSARAARARAAARLFEKAGRIQTANTVHQGANAQKRNRMEGTGGSVLSGDWPVEETDGTARAGSFEADRQAERVPSGQYDTCPADATIATAAATTTTAATTFPATLAVR